MSDEDDNTPMLSGWSISPGVSGVPNVDACVVQEQTRGEGGRVPSEARLITLLLTTRSSALCSMGRLLDGALKNTVCLKVTHLLPNEMGIINFSIVNGMGRS